MNGHEKSDFVVVAMKPANEDGEFSEALAPESRSSAEPVERRAKAEGNADQRSTPRAQDRIGVTQGLARIRQVARERKGERFTSLMHHVGVAHLREAFYSLKRDAAPGVDGMTWQDYEAELELRLRDLHDRVHRGGPYHPLPSRRRWIPKPDGRQRPLGIAALEDKIVQRAVQAALNAIYEEDFLGFSYGFRPGRGQHDALDALSVGIGSRKVNWIVDIDIRSFFDTVSHEWLIRFLEHRIGDRRILRLIQKWLKAGVLEDGTMTASEEGTPQGAVISPLLANIYLHYGIDLWAEQWRGREAGGDMIIVRYADDLVVGFEHETHARRFLDDLRERVATFGLALHPDKTRIIEFGRHAARARASRGLGKPETFNFLGFTFICGTDRRGNFLLKRKSRGDRMRAKLAELKDALRRRMHQPIPEVGKWLAQVVRGYFNYHAVPTNGPALAAFRYHVTKLWFRTVKRRGDRRPMTWERFGKLAADYLPRPRILHPWPDKRFAVRHPRWEPYAGKPHVRFCAGGAQ